MALLPKKPYINIKRACKELNCSIDDLVDCWLSNELDFYYMLQGEKVTIYLQKNDHDFQSKIFMYAANAYDNENTKIYLNKANQEVIKGKAYGAFLISPMRSTYTVQDSINIITREKVLERQKLELLTSGFCFILHPKTRDRIEFDDIDNIDGLNFPIRQLFVMRDDINKFYDKNTQSLEQGIQEPDNGLAGNNRAGVKSHHLKDYAIEIAKNTKNHYLEQEIDLGLNAIATKIKNHEHFMNKGLPSAEQMSKWFKGAGIQSSKTTKIFKFDLIFSD